MGKEIVVDKSRAPNTVTEMTQFRALHRIVVAGGVTGTDTPSMRTSAKMTAHLTGG